MRHFLIYRTVCLVNGHEYTGKHETDNLDDGYLGSGKLIRRAIEKHGRDNFRKEILHDFATVAKMDAKEAELVTEEYCARDDTYNLCPGGDGGWDYINGNEELRVAKNQKARQKANEAGALEKAKIARRKLYEDASFVESVITKRRNTMIEKYGDAKSLDLQNLQKATAAAWSPEAREKRRATMVARGHWKE